MDWRGDQTRREIRDQTQVIQLQSCCPSVNETTQELGLWEYGSCGEEGFKLSDLTELGRGSELCSQYASSI